MGLCLNVVPGCFAVSRLAPDDGIPAWAETGGFHSTTRTPDELSIVCEQSAVPDGIRSDRDWRCIRVEGPLKFSLTGILLSLAEPLAKNRISIFAVSTFDTDYILVKDESFQKAARVLEQSGHSFR